MCTLMYNGSQQKGSHIKDKGIKRYEKPLFQVTSDFIDNLQAVAESS